MYHVTVLSGFSSRAARKRYELILCGGGYELILCGKLPDARAVINVACNWLYVTVRDTIHLVRTFCFDSVGLGTVGLGDAAGQNRY